MMDRDRRRRQALLLMTAVFAATGCVPDLGAWQVVRAGVDAGPDTRVDGGAGQPNPPDLGTPCPNPYVTAATTASSSDVARILRLDARTGAHCRDAPLVSTQPDWGYAIYDVDWGAGTGEVLGIQDAVMGLGADGFPAWRNQPPESDFDGSWVVSLGGPRNLIVAAWSTSSSLSDIRLFDANGQTLGSAIELPFGDATMIAAHPDGSGRLLYAAGGGPIDAVSVSETATSIPRDSGVELFAGSADLYDAFGRRQHIDADLASGRLAMTHERGVAVWTVGGFAPTQAITCASHCDAYHIAVPDPDSDAAAIILCSRSGERHLVHATTAGACTRWIDGTGLGNRTLHDVTLVRTAF